MVGCNWCGATEVKLAENKPYCPDCTSNFKRECTVCQKPYPNLKFYEKHSKRCNSCQSCYIVAKTKKASMENNHRKFGETTSKQKQYDSDEESREEKEEEEEEYKVEDFDDNDSTDRGVIIKEDCSNEASCKTKNIQKASTPPSKRQLTVMEIKRRKENVAKTLLRLQQKSHIFCSR